MHRAIALAALALADQGMQNAAIALENAVLTADLEPSERTIEAVTNAIANLGSVATSYAAIVSHFMAEWVLPQGFTPVSAKPSLN